MDGGVSCNGGGSQLVATDLRHAKELVKQLLDELLLGGSHDLCKHLASQIFSLIDRSIGIVTSSVFDGGHKRTLSDVVDAPFSTNKKRRTVEKRKHQVRAKTPPVDDGHSWRKYGQKDILGAKHPRGYYRCTHRHSQGCAATKQVQRTDEDPELLDVIYVGTHTCVHKTAAGQATQPPDAHSLLQNLSANLTVKTEGLPVAGEPQGWTATTPFSISSTPASGQEVMSTLVAVSTPPAPALDMDDDFLNMDISSFFA